VFSSFGRRCPRPTQFVINLSNFVIAWSTTSPRPGDRFFAIRYAYGTERAGRDRPVPVESAVFGELIRKTAVARFTRTLGTWCLRCADPRRLGDHRRGRGNKVSRQRS
jgi:type IV pilus assembly protein PilC